MLFLILCILSSTAIFIVFRTTGRLGIPSFPLIVINYLAAALLGFLAFRGRLAPPDILREDWLYMSILIGIMFIAMFFLIAESTRKAGISITTIASKMSVVFPILFSLLIDPGDTLNGLKTAAIVLAVPGVALTVYKPRKGPLDLSVVYLPALLFAGMGIVDSCVKYAQHRFVDDPDATLFSAVLFLNAFLSGLAILLVTGNQYRLFRSAVTWVWGTVLGIVNFGSIYFLVRALNHVSHSGEGIDSSVVFGVNNTGIVTLSVLVGFLAFRERPLPVNWGGIVISTLALILFSLGE